MARVGNLAGKDDRLKGLICGVTSCSAQTPSPGQITCWVRNEYLDSLAALGHSGGVFSAVARLADARDSAPWPGPLRPSPWISGVVLLSRRARVRSRPLFWREDGGVQRKRPCVEVSARFPQVVETSPESFLKLQAASQPSCSFGASIPHNAGLLCSGGGGLSWCH